MAVSAEQALIQAVADVFGFTDPDRPSRTNKKTTTHGEAELHAETLGYKQAVDGRKAYIDLAECNLRESLEKQPDDTLVVGATAAIFCELSHIDFVRKKGPKWIPLPPDGEKSIRVVSQNESGKFSDSTRRVPVWSLGALRAWKIKVKERQNNPKAQPAEKRKRSRAHSLAVIRSPADFIPKRRYLITRGGKVVQDMDVVHAWAPDLIQDMIDRGYQIDRMSFLDAMTKRAWEDPAQRRPWADAMLRMVQLHVEAGDKFTAQLVAEEQRNTLDDVLPRDVKPARGSGKGRRM